MKKKEVYLTDFSPRATLFRQVSIPTISSRDRYLKAHTLLFKVSQDYQEVIKALKYFEKEKAIPLDTIKALASKLDSIIASLGSTTICLETKCDETFLITEISQKLCIQDPLQINYLETRLRKFTSSLIRSFRDKHFTGSLDYQKEKAWRLLEALDTYTTAMYKQSIF